MKNSSNPTAYPIVDLHGYWLSKSNESGQRARTGQLLWWILTRAQTNNNALTYPQFAASAVTIAEAEVTQLLITARRCITIN